VKSFVETLRVTNPVRQSRASSREASLAWGRATVTAKHPDRELLGVGGELPGPRGKGIAAMKANRPIGTASEASSATVSAARRRG
jgi:hypothetical protein